MSTKKNQQQQDEQPHQRPEGDQPGPQWAEEWVALDAINRTQALQVRAKLDQGAIKRYGQWAQSGSAAPLIKVARVPSGALYLVDGWHRIEADALERDGGDVRALVAPMSEADARWEAAQANLGHGVPLKPSEYRNVFRAFINAGKHRTKRGKRMSYREMAPLIGKPHTTLRTWMKRDFPAVFRAMGGPDGGNAHAGPPDGGVLSLAEEQQRQALEALEGARRGLPEMTPEGRGIVRAALLQALADLEKLGAVEPVPADQGPEEF